MGKTAENKADFETVLRIYHAYLNISCNEKYAIYSNDKNEIARLLTDGDYSGKSFESFYNDCLLPARINKAENEISAKNIMLAQMSELDLSCYGKLNNSYNENSVFKELCRKRPYDSRKELAEAFSKASKEKYEEINSSSDAQKSGGSGGVGGGGSRGGSSGGGLAGAIYETEENLKNDKGENPNTSSKDGGQSEGAFVPLLRFKSGDEGSFAVYDMTDAYKEYAGIYKRSFYMNREKTGVTVSDRLELKSKSELNRFITTDADAVSYDESMIVLKKLNIYVCLKYKTDAGRSEHI